MVGTICVVSYYASIMGLTIFYFFASFQKDLPWSVCNPDWVGLGTGYNKTIGEQVLFCNESDPTRVFYKDEDGFLNVSATSVAQLYFE